MGSFDKFPEGLEYRQFQDALGNSLLEGYFETFVLTGWLKGKQHRPLGLATLSLQGSFDDGRLLLTPGVVWFPWATARNKVEAWVNFLNQQRKVRLLILRVPMEDKRYMEQMCRYGICRRVGTIEDFFAPGAVATEFQTRAG